jgi:hypothetical protein
MVPDSIAAAEALVTARGVDSSGSITFDSEFGDLIGGMTSGEPSASSSEKAGVSDVDDGATPGDGKRTARSVVGREDNLARVIN